MEEKILIKSERKNMFGKFVTNIIVFVTLVVVCVVFFSIAQSQSDAAYDRVQAAEVALDNIDRDDYEWYSDYSDAVDAQEVIIKNLKDEYYRAGSGNYLLSSLCAVVSVIPFTLAIVFLALHFATRSNELIISDRRAYGCTGHNRVDLPLDSIAAVSMRGKGAISITTTSGYIKFAMIKNRDQVYDVLCKLLVDRNTKKNEPVRETVAAASSADELKKYKDLLDSGIITQEEFDAKKSQLLGL